MREFMEFLRDDINNNSQLPTVRIGQLEPRQNDVSIQLVTSSPENDYFDRGKTIPFSVLVLSKHERQTVALQNVEDIIDHYTRLRVYPQPTSDNFQWLVSFASTYPNYVDKQENKYFIYSAVLVNKIQLD